MHKIILFFLLLFFHYFIFACFLFLFICLRGLDILCFPHWRKKTVLERFDFLISVLNERMRYCILWYLSIFHFLCEWNQKLLIKKNIAFVVSCKTIYHNKPRVIVIFFNICVSMQTKLSPKETICMKDQSRFFLGRLWYSMLQVVFWGDNLLDISKPSSGKIRKLPSICPLLILPLSGKCELLAISSFIFSGRAIKRLLMCCVSSPKVCLSR